MEKKATRCVCVNKQQHTTKSLFDFIGSDLDRLFQTTICKYAKAINMLEPLLLKLY